MEFYCSSVQSEPQVGGDATVVRFVAFNDMNAPVGRLTMRLTGEGVGVDFEPGSRYAIHVGKAIPPIEQQQATSPAADAAPSGAGVAPGTEPA